MLLPRTGASQPARDICLLLSVVSTLVMSVFAAPGAALDLKANTSTTCAGPLGAWTVGVNKTDNMLTFVHSSGTVVSTAYQPSITFKGGHCFESEKTVYYISDEATGNLTIKSPDQGYTWFDYKLRTKTPSKNRIDQDRFVKEKTTIGSGPNNTINFIAVTQDNIIRWAPNAESYTGVANLDE